MSRFCPRLNCGWSGSSDDKYCAVCGSATIAGEQSDASKDAWLLRDCPFCAEPIKRIAKRCKHCQATIERTDEIARLESEEKLAAALGCNPWELDVALDSRLAAKKADLKGLDALHQQVAASGATTFAAKTGGVFAVAVATARHEAAESSRKLGLTVEVPPSTSVDNLLKFIALVEVQQGLRRRVTRVEKTARRLGLVAKPWPEDGQIEGADVESRERFITSQTELRERLKTALDKCVKTLDWGPESRHAALLARGELSSGDVEGFEALCERQIDLHAQIFEAWFANSKSWIQGVKAEFPSFPLGRPSVDAWLARLPLRRARKRRWVLSFVLIALLVVWVGLAYDQRNLGSASGSSAAGVALAVIHPEDVPKPMSSAASEDVPKPMSSASAQTESRTRKLADKGLMADKGLTQDDMDWAPSAEELSRARGTAQAENRETTAEGACSAATKNTIARVQATLKIGTPAFGAASATRVAQDLIASKGCPVPDAETLPWNASPRDESQENRKADLLDSLNDDGGKPVGHLGKSQIDNTVRRRLGPIRRCYEKRLAASPSLSGSVVLAFDVLPSGKVGKVTVQDEESSLVDPPVYECLRRQFGMLHFPKPAGGSKVSVTFPLQFSPN